MECGPYFLVRKGTLVEIFFEKFIVGLSDRLEQGVARLLGGFLEVCGNLLLAGLAGIVRVYQGLHCEHVHDAA